MTETDCALKYLGEYFLIYVLIVLKTNVYIAILQKWC